MKHPVLTLGIPSVALLVLGLAGCAAPQAEDGRRVGEVHPDLADRSTPTPEVAPETAGVQSEDSAPEIADVADPSDEPPTATPDGIASAGVQEEAAEPVQELGVDPNPTPSPANLETARDEVQRAVHPRGYAQSGETLLLWNDPRFQRYLTESYKAVTDVEPPVNLEELEELQKIFDWIGEDKGDKALARLEERRKGRTAVYDYTLGTLHFGAGEMDKARAAYEDALVKYEQFLRAHRNLGIILTQGGEFVQGAAHLTRSIELGGGDGLVYGLLGYCYLGLEEALSAETAYRMAVLLDPNTYDWKIGLARSLFKQERFPEAISLTGSMIDRTPDRTELWMLQANAFIGQGMALRAAENYEMVDRLGGSTPASLNMLGDIYTNESLYGMAAGAYVRALRMDPSSDPGRSVRNAQVLTFRGAHEEAREMIAEVKDLQEELLEDKHLKDLLKLEARIAVAEGAGEEEVRILEQIVVLDPLDGEALLLLGQNASRGGDDTLADNYYQRAEQLEDHAPDAKVRRAQLCVKQGRYNEAIQFLKQAQDLKPRENIREYLEQVEKVQRSR